MGQRAKLPTAAQTQGLVKGLPQMPMGTLDIAVFVGLLDADHRRRESVMVQQPEVADIVIPSRLATTPAMGGGRTLVGLANAGHAPQFEQRALQAPLQAQKRFAIADPCPFPVGIG
jgi:hypothetical protein